MDVEISNCSMCGNNGIVQRKYYYYDIKCDCCNSKDSPHFEIVWHCNNCVPKPPQSLKVMMNPLPKQIPYTKKQDDDGHWYWIPNTELRRFREDLEKITGVDYMDKPDEFDDFSYRYEKYRTMGDPDNVPEFYKEP